LTVSQGLFRACSSQKNSKLKKSSKSAKKTSFQHHHGSLPSKTPRPQHLAWKIPIIIIIITNTHKHIYVSTNRKTKL
jgi:hypothetical protein